MIVFLPNSYQLGQDILALFSDRLPGENNVLFAVSGEDFSGMEGDRQCRFLDGNGSGPCVFSEKWRNVVPPRPQRNQLLLVWERCEETLFALLDFLNRQQGDYSFDICLVLSQVSDNYAKLLEYRKTNPIDRVLVDTDGTKQAPSLIRTIWYLGNEDNENNAISDVWRISLVQELVEAILYTGCATELVQHLALYPEDTLETQFVSYGINSWIPSSENASSIVKRTSWLVEERACGGQKDLPEQSFGETVKSIFSELDWFGISMDNQGTQAMRFTEELPKYDATPFDDWSCPFFRKSAQESGQYAIDEKRQGIAAFHSQLKSKVAELAHRIRARGQVALATARNRSHSEIRGKNEDAPIPRIIGVLKSFFPEVKKQFDSLHSCTPCQALSDPTDQERTKAFVFEPKQRLAGLCEQELPSNKSWIICLVSVILLYIVSYVSFRFQWDWRITLGFVVVPTLVLAGFLLYVRNKGKAIKNEMIEYFQGKNNWLHSSYVDKTKWIIDNTRQLAIRQLASDLLSTGRRLQRNFNAIFADSMPANAQMNNERELQRLCDEMNLTENDLQELQVSIMDEVKQLLADTLDSSEQISGSSRILAAKSRWVSGLVRRSRRTEFQPSAALRNDLDICMQRRKPTLTSRIDELERLDNMFFKVFILGQTPEYENWGREWKQRARNNIINLYVWQGEIPAPVVIMFRPRLSLKEMETTLAVTEVR